MAKAKQAIFAWAETVIPSMIRGQQVVAYTPGVNKIELDWIASQSPPYSFAYGGKIKFRKSPAQNYAITKHFDIDDPKRPHLPYAHTLIFDEKAFKEIGYRPPLWAADLLEFKPEYRNSVDPKLVGGTLPEVEIENAPKASLENLLESLGKYKPLLLKTAEILKAKPTERLAVFVDDMDIHNKFIDALYLSLPEEKRKEVAFCTRADCYCEESLAIAPLDPAQSMADFFRCQAAEKEGRKILTI